VKQNDLSVVEFRINDFRMWSNLLIKCDHEFFFLATRIAGGGADFRAVRLSSPLLPHGLGAPKRLVRNVKCSRA
jgi:hypothetical protein